MSEEVKENDWQVDDNGSSEGAPTQQDTEHEMAESAGASIGEAEMNTGAAEIKQQR